MSQKQQNIQLRCAVRYRALRSERERGSVTDSVLLIAVPFSVILSRSAAMSVWSQTCLMSSTCSCVWTTSCRTSCRRAMWSSARRRRRSSARDRPQVCPLRPLTHRLRHLLLEEAYRIAICACNCTCPRERRDCRRLFLRCTSARACKSPSRCLCAWTRSTPWWSSF